uniref:Uncharacterized protein n=1 Tax=Ditylenchus dipsaci TaxID=166011 RepID=A0A915DJ54_9BILA
MQFRQGILIRPHGLERVISGKAYVYIDCTASQIASTVNNLKSKYYKYLETLCNANDVNISTLKTNGADYEKLELFFGGLPVLVGLKYFEHLRVLRLFGQDLLSIKPLNEVCETLEELWVCEGPLKDISGLESCKKLRQLYLFDCKIENGAGIGKLTVLKIGGQQFSDPAAMSIEKWPSKLQNLDISGNSLTSFRPIVSVTQCSVLRYQQMAWIAFHFFYLERLNGDFVLDKFSTIYASQSEMDMIEQLHKLLDSEKTHRAIIERINKNSEKIDEKLRSLAVALGKAVQTVSKKEGRRELAQRMHEQTQANLMQLKNMKKNCIKLEHSLHKLRYHYLPSWHLESGHKTCPKQLEQHELHNVEEFLKLNCSKREEFLIHVKYAHSYLGGQFIEPSALNSLFITKTSDGSALLDNELRVLINFCDRRDCLEGFDHLSLEIFKDISLLGTIIDANCGFLFLPLFKCKSEEKRLSKPLDPPLPDGNQLKVGIDSQHLFSARKDEEELLKISDLELAIVCIVEISYTSQIQFDDLRNVADFEERMNIRLRKLKELGIEVKLEKILSSIASEEIQIVVEHANDGSEAKEKPKRKLDEMIGTDILHRSTKQFCRKKWLSEQLPNLCFLNIAQNKISSLKKLRALQNLTFLDASSNAINKIDELPAMLSELNLSRNHISCLNFCAELQNFSKITVVDLSGCAISETDSFRKRLLLLCPTLLSINREKVPMEEKNLMQKKSGKVLTWDFLEKNVTNLKTGTFIELVKQDFRMIALDRMAIANLSHITLVDLSRNALEHVYELVDLPNLLILNLSHNCIVSLASTPLIAGTNAQTQILPKLECLNLSYNNLTNQTLLRVGIAHLTQLKRLILIGNQITKFDASGLDLPQLQELDISKNEIKSIKKKPMKYLKTLSLAENKLRDIDGLVAPSLARLDLSNNKIGTCAAIKPISTMVELKELLCAGNPVVERRVYSDFITSQTNKLQLLDGEPITSNRVTLSVQKRKSSVVQVHQKDSSTSRQPVVAYSRRSFDNGISLFPQEQYNPWSRLPLRSSSRIENTNSLSLTSSTSSLRNLEKKLSVPNIRSSRSSRRSPSPTPIEKRIYSRKSINSNDSFYIAGISLLKRSKS